MIAAVKSLLPTLVLVVLGIETSVFAGNLSVTLSKPDPLLSVAELGTGANIFSKEDYQITNSDGTSTPFPLRGVMNVKNPATGEKWSLDAGLSASVLTTTYGSHFLMQNYDFEFRQNRQKLFQFEKKAKFAYRFQRTSAPLMFIIPGLGGVSSDKTPQALAYKFFQMGYHVVVIDNNLTPQFAIQISRDGLVGYMPRDAEDTYEYLVEVLKRLQTKSSFVVKSWNERSTVPVAGVSVMGYSLGGLMAAHLAKVDSEQGKIKFQKIGVFNPPIDMAKSVASLDDFNQPISFIAEEFANLSTTERENLLLKLSLTGDPGFGKFPLAVESTSQLLKVPAAMREIYSPGAAPDKGYARLAAYARLGIGATFSITLGQVVLVVNQLKGLKNADLDQIAKGFQHDDISQRPLGMDAIDISFAKYIDDFLVPVLTVETGLEKDQLMNNASLTSLGALLKQDQRVVLFHNADDFLVNGLEDLKFLAQTFGPRANLFTYGGHCGNYWFPLNLAILEKAFKIN